LLGEGGEIKRFWQLTFGQKLSLNQSMFVKVIASYARELFGDTVYSVFHREEGTKLTAVILWIGGSVD